MPTVNGKRAPTTDLTTEEPVRKAAKIPGITKQTEVLRSEVEHVVPLSDALRQAIRSIDEHRLRRDLERLCEEADANGHVKRILGDWWLTKGKNVVRYHEDTESEDRGESDEEEGEEDDGDSDSEREVQRDGHISRQKDIKVLKNIEVGGEELTPIYVKCENCEEEFDVRSNERGDCVWHYGDKELNYESSLWDDHDENCHGNPHDFVDDSDYAEGFTYTCCEKSGDADGCKVTRHKAAVNVVVKS